MIIFLFFSLFPTRYFEISPLCPLAFVKMSWYNSPLKKNLTSALFVDTLLIVVVDIQNPLGSPTLSQKARVKFIVVLTSGQNSLKGTLLAVSRIDPAVPTIGGGFPINTFLAPLS